MASLEEHNVHDDPNSEEDESVSASVDEEASESDGHEAHNGTVQQESSGKSKKKKKKRKKKTGGGGGDTASPSAAERKAADARFQEAVQLLSTNDEDGMWIKLSNCFLQDAKVAKLCEAMANNTQVTSIDLSCNCLTKSAAEVLAAALARKNNAPDLILLDVRGNPIDDDALDALRQLPSNRKDLKIESGPIIDPTPIEDIPSSSSSSETKGGEGLMVTGGGGAANGLPSWTQRFFQVGNDGPGDDDEEPVQDPEETSKTLWESVSQVLDSDPIDIPTLSSSLIDIVRGVCDEMLNCALPMLPSTTVGDLRPYTRGALGMLHELQQALLVVPPPVMHSFDRGEYKPAVGVHRTSAAELIAQLLRGGCGALYQPIAEACIIPQLVLLALHHPTNNALQCATLSAIQVALASPTDDSLGQHLLTLGMGLETCTALSDYDNGNLTGALVSLGVPQKHAEGGPVLPLQQMVAQQATIHVDTSIGRRPCHVGFIIAVGRLLQAAADTPDHWAKPLLHKDAAWVACAAPGGALASLTAEQEGYLGGSKPERFDTSGHDFFTGGLGLLNQSWLAMLPTAGGGGGNTGGADNAGD